MQECRPLSSPKPGARLQTSLAIALVALQSVACGTLANGTKQRIEIASIPPGARVRFEPADIELVTPAVVELPRKRDQLATFELAGHDPRARQINRQISGWFVANLLLGGIPGILIDLLTGGAWMLEPDQIEIELTPIFVPERNP